MSIIDAQVHAYERDHPGRPWAGVLPGPPECTGDDMVAAMDAVGVDGAILVSPATMYRFDSSYAVAAHAAHPDRFGLVTPVDTTDPAVNERIADWAKTDGAVAIRIMLVDDVTQDPDDPGLATILRTAARHDLPVNILCWERLQQAAALAAKAPDTRIVIDHLGLLQPFAPPPPPEPFAELAKVLGLAVFDNLVIKITGACTLSHKPYPYEDIWEPLGRMFDAFGIDRCLWGTDWTRAVALLSYQQGVEPFRLTDKLSESDRAALMGGNAERVYGWSPS